ncbi:inositol 1,4,5-triphosphate receptor associated 2 isoform X2 [Brienomyrus brachyistius]|uniref:inositol 1,4,5-triphosphate receptor associated 2 isoform X2 n=1 Tax=Brienomyrus brachyistius TaxID=42636 RepID=UPI0020B41FC1|nr:inositol 1,4,5-triphosphate receptor associated 2 isoform X2 [Brienomyrus brachyistius]
MDTGVMPRRHNPVDSICRKLRTIQRHDQEANSPFQIPKFRSRSYDSPQCGLRHNLEAILKKRAVRSDSEPPSPSTPGTPCTPHDADLLTPTGSPGVMHTPSYLATPTNTTYTITSALVDRRGPSEGGPWSRICSTPAAQTNDGFFSFSRCTTYTKRGGRLSDGDPLESPTPGMLSYNLNFCSTDSSNLQDGGGSYPALVVKRLSMGDGTLCPSEGRKESMAEVSLICEEDLLDTIFHACDTQRRGKVYVSCLVDYLRHTTSRGSEDSGLEELCNMLDPERKDVSIDLDTYHAIMKEWIEDCRNQGDSTPEDLTQESVKLKDSLSARRSALLNMTSGSLEAFGGEASRGDLETSDLVYCVADLQFNNQKLQEEVRKLKQAVEAMEESNQKLMEENEELQAQAKLGQQSAQKEKLLKEEVEVMKATLSASEEGRARVSAQSKQTEEENQGLISKIASLQEENLKITMESDDLQKKIIELCDLNTDLQVQIHAFDGVLNEKDALVLERNQQIEELKAAIIEYSSVTEVLRADKARLESQMQMMLPDLGAASLSLSVAYRLNQMSSGSLQAELALAQGKPEVLEKHSSFASSLDETLDREVLLLLQGPTPEQMSLEFKAVISKLNQDFKEDSYTVLSAVKGLFETYTQLDSGWERKMQSLQVDLEQRRRNWARSIEQLEEYTASLEKELIKMASNMRRSRTEILHLSVRVQEQESQKQQLRDELAQLQMSDQEAADASSQTEDARRETGDASCQTEGRPRQAVDSCSQTEDLLQEGIDSSSQTEAVPWDGIETSCQTEDPIRQGIDVSCQTEEDLPQMGVEASSQTEDCSPPEGTHASSQTEEDLFQVSGGSGAHALGEEGAIIVCEAEDDLLGQRNEEMNALDEDEQMDLGGLWGAELQASLPLALAVPLGQGSRRVLEASVGMVKDGLRRRSVDLKPEDGVPECTSPEDSTHRAAWTAGVISDHSLRPHSHFHLINALTLELLLPPSRVWLPLPKGGSLQDLTLLDGSRPVLTREGACPPEEEEGEDSIRKEDTTAPGMSDNQSPVDQVPSSSVTADRLPLTPGKGQEAMQVLPEEKSRAASPELVAGRGDGSPVTSIYRGPLPPSENRAVTDDGLSPPARGGQSPQALRDSMNLRNKFKREMVLSRSMEAIEENNTQEDLGEASEKEGENPLNGEDASDENKEEDKDSLSQSEKEIETEFHRLSLGFKCDMFTLEKRLRLEERSRDLAEDNMKREVSSCQGLLLALIPLCGDDNQSMEIIQRLGKNLDILIQSMSRVSTRSEMLGAIHQENRVSKVVEVMIQHVENLRRMYTKEHAELMELKETLIQNERSFGSLERDDFRNKKMSGSQYYKPSTRRVSIAVIPRNSGGPANSDMTRPHDTTDTEAETLRRNSWKTAGKNSLQPSLKRVVNSCAWAKSEDSFSMKGYESEWQSLTEEQKEENAERKSGSKMPSLVMSSMKPDQTSPSLVASQPVVPKGGRSLWLTVALAVLLAALLAVLASVALQPAVDAAPVGPGDSWVTIQQFLWPYTGLRHNGQPPV